MLAVRLWGPRVITRPESIGITSLGDRAHRQPDDLVQEVNTQSGRPIRHPPMATRTMTNVIAAAGQAELR